MNRRSFIKAIGAGVAAVAGGLGLSKAVRPSKAAGAVKPLTPLQRQYLRLAQTRPPRNLADTERYRAYLYGPDAIPDGTPMYHDPRGGCVTADGRRIENPKFICQQSGIMVKPPHLDEKLPGSQALERDYLPGYPKQIIPEPIQPDYAKCATNIADGPVVPLGTERTVNGVPEMYVRRIRVDAARLYFDETADVTCASVAVYDPSGKLVDRYDLRDGIRLMEGER